MIKCLCFYRLTIFDIIFNCHVYNKIFIYGILHLESPNPIHNYFFCAATLAKGSKVQFWFKEMEQKVVAEEAGQIDNGLPCQDSVGGSRQ